MLYIYYMLYICYIYIYNIAELVYGRLFIAAFFSLIVAENWKLRTLNRDMIG